MKQKTLFTAIWVVVVSVMLVVGIANAEGENNTRGNFMSSTTVEFV